MKRQQIHYKTIKCKLKDILLRDVDYSKFYDIIDTSNKLVTLCYMFMRAFILYCYDKKMTIPIINEKFIRDTIKILTISGGNGPKSIIDCNLLEFYEKVFIKKVINFTKIKISNMTFTNTELVSEMLISINNIIIKNYNSCLNNYIWAHIDDYYKDSNKTKKEKKVIFNHIKNIFVGNEEYIEDHFEWIQQEQCNIIPDTLIKNGYEKDIECNTSNYIKPMIYMNKIFEKKKIQMVQFFPLRKTIYPKYVTFNTSSIIDIFVKKNKAEYLKYTSLRGDKIWRTYFNLKKLKLKNHSFGLNISTDGFTVSVAFINDNDKIKLNLKKERMTKGRILSKQKGYIKKTDNDKSKMKLKKLIKDEQYKKDCSAKFKKLSSKKQKEIIFNKKLKETYPYIETLIKSELGYKRIKEYMDKGQIVVADPGKRSSLYMMGLRRKNEMTEIKNNKRLLKFKKFKFLNFTNKHRLRFTKRSKYTKKSNSRKYNHKINNKRIMDYEHELTDYNSKTCTLCTFWKYVNKKLEINKILTNEYNDTFYRKINWYSYLDRRRYDDKMMNTIADTYGKDATIVLGDWSMKGKLRFISTPNCRIKRKLAEKFNVITIDEFNTSKIHYKHKIPCNKMKCETYKKTKKDIQKEVKELYEQEKDNKKYNGMERSTLMKKLKEKIQKLWENPVTIKLHSVLTSKTGKVMECINRDKNAVLNMWHIVENLIKTKQRPQIFQRNQCAKDLSLDKSSGKTLKATNNTVKVI